MKRHILLGAIAVCSATISLSAGAQEKGGWRPASKTAQSITGDLEFSSDKISINLNSFTIAQIRSIKPEEAAALFDEESTAGGRGNLYRLDVPAAKRFLHRNTLCADQDTQWIATFVTGHTLQMALFSSGSMPVFTHDALANSTDLCGTYTYVR